MPDYVVELETNDEDGAWSARVSNPGSREALSVTGLTPAAALAAAAEYITCRELGIRRKQRRARHGAG